LLRREIRTLCGHAGKAQHGHERGHETDSVKRPLLHASPPVSQAPCPNKTLVKSHTQSVNAKLLQTGCESASCQSCRNSFSAMPKRSEPATAACSVPGARSEMP